MVSFKKGISLFLFILIFGSFCFVPNIYSNSVYSQKIDNYTRFRNFTIKDGLSSNFVLDILQDKYGIIWIATLNGLNRFDGSKFTIYNEINALNCNQIMALAEDYFGNIWIGTQNGLNIYDRKTNRFSIITGLKNNYIKALYVDKSNCLWVETKDGFLSRFDIVKKEWSHISHPTGNFEGDYFYHHIFEDSFENLWIGGRNLGAVKVNGKDINRVDAYVKNINHEYHEASGFVETLDSSLICISHFGRMSKYNKEKNVFERINEINENDMSLIDVTSAICDEDGKIWMGAIKDEGIRIVDLKQKEITYIKNNLFNPQSLLSNDINCFFKDGNGNIWIGTDQGISLYSKKINYFRHYKSILNLKDSPRSNQVKAIIEDNDGLIWIGTDNGVDTFSLSKEKFGNISYNLLDKHVDEKTFFKEKYTLEQYKRHGLLNAKDNDAYANYRQYRDTYIEFKDRNENDVTSLYQDRNEIIYIGLWSHVGFNTYNKKTKEIKRYALWSGPANHYYPILFEGNPFGANWYSGFCEDNQSRFWCATWEGFGLNLFDREKGKFIGKHYIPGNQPKVEKLHFAYDPASNRMYLGWSDYYGYYDFIQEKFVRFGEKFPQDYFNRDIIMDYYNYCDAIFVDLPLYFESQNILHYNDAVWIIARNEIIKHTLLKNDFDIIISSVGNIYRTMAKSFDDKHLWVSEENKKIYKINLSDNKVDSIETDSISVIRTLYEDHQGILWIGTDEGIYLLDYQNGEKIIKLNINSEFRNITTIIGHVDNSILAVSQKGLLGIKDKKVVKIYPFSYPKADGLPGTVINHIFKDSDNKFWICTNEGIVHLDLTTNKLNVYQHNPYNPESILGNIVNSASEDGNKDIWISTTNGLCKFQRKTGKFIDLSKPDNNTLSSRLASCIIMDKTGNIWLGTTEKGINVLNTETDKIRHYIHYSWDENSISDNNIECIFEGTEGDIWIGARKGLNKYRPESDNFVSVPELSELSIMNIQEDTIHNLWVSTNNGLYCLDKYGKIKKVFYNYHGLQGNDFNCAGFKLKNGMLIFGGNNGFTVFDPSKVMQELHSPNIVLSNFRVKDILYIFDLNGREFINLDYIENSFSLDFCTTDYEYGDFLQYRYKLENFDEDWIYTDAKALTAKYTNLPHGKYTFMVEVTNSQNEWKSSPKKITILIATPWYYQWWFYLIMSLIGISVIIAIIKLRERRLKAHNIKLQKEVEKQTKEINSQKEELKKMNDVKDKFFGIISHDLKNPLSALNILFDQFESIEESDMVEIIQIMKEETQKTNSLLENLLSWAHSQMKLLKPKFLQINLKSEIDETINSLELPANIKNLSLTNTIPSNIHVFADINFLSVIHRNLLSNAIKYSYQNSDIIIESHINGDFIEVSIKDNGAGIKEKNKEKIFRIDSKIQTKGTNNEQGTGLGLILVKEFVELLGGKIWFNSEENKGSIFTFSLKRYKDGRSY